MKSYTELIKLKTFEERFAYLAIGGAVGVQTFGSARPENQEFYGSGLWKATRRDIIMRDDAMDLGVKDHEIPGIIVVHHINPLMPSDLQLDNPMALDPDNLISVWYITHKALHYGNIDLLPRPYKERTPNDTIMWKPLGRRNT